MEGSDLMTSALERANLSGAFDQSQCGIFLRVIRLRTMPFSNTDSGHEDHSMYIHVKVTAQRVRAVPKGTLGRVTANHLVDCWGTVLNEELR